MMEKKRSLACILAILMVLNIMFSTIVFASNNVVYSIFDDKLADGKYVQWSGTNLIATTKQVKSGKNALEVSFSPGAWQGATLDFAKKVTSVKDINNTAVAFWIKTPRNMKPTAIFQLTTNNGGKTVMANIDIGKYINAEQYGKWTYVQLPLASLGDSGESWNSSKNANEMVKHNWGQISGIGFKVDGSKLSDVYTMYMDSVEIIGNIDHGLDTVTGAANVGEMLEPTVNADGSIVYLDIFKDYVKDGAIDIWSGSSAAKLEGSRYKEGNASLSMSFAPGAWQGAKWSFNNAVLFPKDKLDKMALSFWIKVPEYTTFTLGFTAMINGNSVKVEQNIFDYLYSDQIGQWAKIVIPISDFEKTGIYWDAKTNRNEGVEFVWDAVSGLSFTVNTSGRSSAYNILLDQVQLVECEGVSGDVGVKLLDENEYNKAAVNQTFSKVDLKPFMNMAYKDEVAYDGVGGWIDQGLDDMRNFKLSGEQKFLNIPFDIVQPEENSGKSCVVLRGQNRMYLPNEVTIPINDTAKGLYFLHTAAWISDKAGEYIVYYEDGTRERIVINNKTRISDWGAKFKSDEGRTVYSVKNDENKDGSIGVFSWANPKPDVKIKNIVARTSGDSAFLILLGITLTKDGPFMIETEKFAEANPDMTMWYPYEQPDPFKLKGSVLDMSVFHDAPAGKHGFINQKGEDFVFDDGEVVQFMGTNIVAECIFQPKEVQDKLVERVVSAGYNLVRFHHMDAAWSQLNLFGNGDVPTTELDAQMLDRFEYLWSQFKERGVYLYVDTLVSRKFKEGELDKDALPGVGEGAKIQGHFEPSIIKRQKEFIEQLFTHVNPYTNTSLANDPALVMTEIHNEDSLLWREALGWAIVTPYYENKLRGMYNDWLGKKYKSSEEIATAWKQDGRVGLEDSEKLENGSILIRNNYLEKINNYSVPRLIDTRNFLYDVQTSYYKDMYDFCRNTVGLKCMIAGSNAPEPEDTADIMANLGFDNDFIDRHYYYNHPTWGEWDYATGGTLGDALNSMLTKTDTSLVQHFGERKVYGMPYVQSEWNSCDPNQYLGESMMMMPAYASLNNWNSIQFQFLQGYVPTNNKITQLFETYSHPVRTALVHGTAPMFLRHDVAQAEEGYYVEVTKEQALNPEFIPEIPTGMPMIAKTGLMYTEEAKTNPDTLKSNQKIYDMATSANGDYVSITGELRWSENDKLFEINTDGSQGFSGFPDGKVQHYNDVDFDIKNYFTSIILTDLGKEGSINKADNLLLTVSARTRNANTSFADDASVITSGGGAPIVVEPVEGVVTLKTRDDYKVYALTSSGERKTEVPVTLTENGATFQLKNEYQTTYYEIVKTNNVENDAVENNVKPQWAKKTEFETVYPFDDVSQCEWALSAISKLKNKNIVSGPNFSPNDSITKGEYVAWLVEFLGLQGESRGNFADVTNENKNYKAISIAKENGLIVGDQENNFQPNSPLTRENMMIIGARVLINHGALPLYDAVDLSNFTDANMVSDYAKAYVYRLICAGVVSGDNGKLNPQSYGSRGESAVFIEKLQQQIQQKTNHK